MKLFIIGDSISVQYGPHLETCLSGVMTCARKRGEDLALQNLDIPQGTNNGDSGMVLFYLDAMARHKGIDADLLIVNCGLHDIKTDPATGKRQVELDQYRENLRGIARVAQGLRPRLVWVRTTPCDEAVHNKPGMAFHRFAADCEAYNQAADAIMGEAGVPILDLYTFTRNLGQDVYCDHVHFHPHIREKQAAFIAGWLMGFIAGRPAQA